MGGPSPGLLPKRSQHALGAARLTGFRFHRGIIADGFLGCPSTYARSRSGRMSAYS
jgi:hypothetical protein